MRKINLEDNSQTFSISNLTQKSMEDSNISLQVGVQGFFSMFLFVHISYQLKVWTLLLNLLASSNTSVTGPYLKGLCVPCCCRSC